nr:GGDEF domain-containing protein [uncultured Butyrivibrio sp.]
MDIRRRIRALIFSLCAIVLVVLVILFLGSNRYKSPRHFNLVQLSDGWTVKCASNTYTPDDLTKLNLGIANKGDAITLTRTLGSYALDSATINFRSILSTVDVYLDGSPIYSFGHEYLANGEMLPKYQHFITLPRNYEGKELTIVITPDEDNAFSGLSPIIIGDMEDITRTMSQGGRLPLTVGVFLVTFGFVLIILSPLLLYNTYHDLSIAFSGLISFCMGIYILCYNDLFWIFSDAPAAYTFLEYFSLFTIPAGILFFLASSKHITSKKAAIVLGIINVSFSIVTALLHLTNLVHICHFVSWLHVLALSEGILVIASLICNSIKRYRKMGKYSTKNTSTNVLLLGLMGFLGCCLVDIVKFNILKFFGVGEVNANIDFMTVGALLFIVSLVINYFFHCIEYISESTTKRQLEGLAYTDTLTGISNRSRCELYLAKITGDYTIISIDLDYLKYTNDNYGHTEGDRLISTFSQILQDSFTDASLVGRMGGDEFIVILPYADNNRTNRDINCFNDQLKYRNSIESHLKFSASYGFADSKDPALKDNLTPQKVYLLADSRMYQMKKQHHQETLGRLYDDLIKDMNMKGGKNND